MAALAANWCPAQTVTANLVTGGSANAVAVNLITNKVYVANGSGSLTVVDGASNNITTVTTGGSPSAVAVNPVTNKIYVGSSNSGTVIELDGSGNGTSAIATSTGSYSVLAVNPITNKIYAASSNGTVTVIDGATHTAVAVTAGASPIAISLNPVTNKIYVANSGSKTVTVIDGATNNTSTIAVGTNPSAIAVNQITNKIYVANAGSGSVTVIDGASSSTSSVAVGANPASIAISPVTNKIYVANQSSGSVTVIDGGSNATTSVALGANPISLALNPATNRLYVTGTNVTVIDGGTLVTTSVTTGATSNGVAVNPVTNKIYAVNSNNSLTVIDGSTYGVASVATGAFPVAAAVNPVTNRIYAANQNSGNVTVINGASNTAITVTAGSSPKAVGANPVTNKVYVANSGSNTVTVIDGATNTANSVAVGANPSSVVVNPITNTIYTGNSNGVTVINGAAGSTASVALSQAVTAMAVNVVTNKLYVAAGNVLSVVDGFSNSVIATMAVGTGPTAVAVNAVTNKIYVAASDGTVTVVDGASNNTVSVSAGSLPVSLAVNSITNKVYVANSGGNTVTVIDGASNNTSTVPVGTGPLAIAINQATNKIYVANGQSGNVTVIDGVSSSTANLPMSNSPNALAINPVTSELYVTTGNGNSVIVFSEETLLAAPLTTSITALTNNQTSSSNPNFTLTAGSTTASAPDGAYFQVDGRQNGWSIATGGNGTFSATTATLQPGFHMLYAFATDGQENASTQAGSALTGVIQAYGFLVVPQYASPVTVGTNITGTAFTVDGAQYTSTQTFQWIVGSSHSISVVSPQAGAAGVQSVFTGWSDGTSGLSETLVAGSGASTHTANFNTQYLLTTAASTASWGTVSPGGYFNANAVVPLTAAASSGNLFLNWTGSVANSTNASTTVTMSGPKSVTANFVSNAPPTILSVTPSSGSGTTQSFSGVSSDQNGGSYLSAIYMLFNSSVSASNGCYVQYYPITNLMYLKNDAGTANSAGVTPGSAVKVSNSQCTLSAAGSSYIASGNTGTLTLALTFSGTAATNVYLYASDKNGNNSGFVQKGTWGVSAGPPSAVSITPGSGSSLTQTFAAVYSDPNGASDLSLVSVLFNALVSSSHACYVSYNPILNLLYLTNDAATAQSTGITPGSSATVSNSQCTLAASGSSYVTSANTATLKVALTFSATTPTSSYLYAAENNGSNSGWVQKGSWGVSAGPPAVVSISPSSGSAITQNFVAVYYDPNGASDLSTVAVLFNTQVSSSHGCYVSYSPVFNLLYLTNDSASGQSPGITPGSSNTVSNSQCTLSALGSSYTTSGSTATLSLALTFSGTAPTGIYLLAAENNGSISGWIQKGSWGASAGPPVAVSVTPSSGFGISQTFSAVYSDPNGAADLSTLSLLFNGQISALNGCYVSYNPVLNLLYLTNDADTAQSNGIVPGSGGSASNSQCTLSGTGSSYSVSGNTAMLNVALTFSGSAATNIYLLAAERNGSSSGWIQKGSWAGSAGPPLVVSVSPSLGYLATQTFVGTYSDPNGAADLSTVGMLFNTQANTSHGCAITFNAVSNLLYLANDAGTGPLSGVTPGTAATVSNSQCTLSGLGSSYSAAGNTATLTVAVTFSGTVSTAVYLSATESNGSASGWVQKGTWVLSAGPPTAVSVTPNSGYAATQTFAGVYSDPNGVSDLATVSMLFNTQISATHGCYVSYNTYLNLLYLTDDADAGQSAGVTPGTPATVSNSQCTLSGAGSSYTVSGNTATLRLALAFSGTSPVGIYLNAAEKNGTTSGWLLEGNWGLSAGPPAAVSITPNSGSGAQIFQAVYLDPNGAVDLNTLAVLVNTSISAAHGCYVTYNPILNLLFLTNDTNTGQTAGLTPGSTGTVSNSQCTLAGTGSGYSTSGNLATLTVALTINGAAPQGIYLFAGESNGTNSGWVPVGSWGLSAGPPAVLSVTPSWGSGATQIFSGVFSDPNGAADLSSVNILFNTQISAANGCYVAYNPFLNLLYLTNDNDTAQSAGLTPGSAATLSNSQCTVSGTGSSYAISGNTATLTIAVTFSGSTPTNIYLNGQGNNGSNTGWVLKGTWGGALLNSVQVTLGNGSSVITYSQTSGNVHLTAPASKATGACNGQTVLLTLDNVAAAVFLTASGSPAESVCVAAGKQDAGFYVTTNSVTGSATITGFGPQLQSGTASFVVNARQLNVALASPVMGQGDMLSGTVTLADPAPSFKTYGGFPNGVTLTLAGHPSGIVNISGSVTIPAGQTTGNFMLSGVSAGPVTLSTSPATGYVTASANVTVTASTQAITLPQNLTVAAGQTVSYPVSIGAPAASPVSVSFSVAGLIGSASISPTTVTIPTGATSPTTQPLITIGSAGTVLVTATAPGFGSATGTINLSPSITLTPNPLTILTAATAQLTLSSSIAAPAGGLALNLTVSDPTKATVPPTVTIPAGQSTVAVSITGLTAGSITLTASGVGLAPATAAISIAYPGSFSMIGDSRTEFLTAGAETPTNITAYQWFNAANALNGHNMLLVGAYGIGGDRSDQFLNANLATALSDTAGTLIFNSGAANDIGQCNDAYINANGVAVTCSNVASVAAGNIIKAANAALAAGKQVIVVSETGGSAYSPSQVQALFAYNQLLQAYTAQTNGVFYFDATPYYWASSSTASISLKPGVSVDGLHPNTLGSFYIAQGFAKWISSTMPSNQYLTTHVAGTGGDYITNTLFTNPTGGTATGTVSGALPSGFNLRVAPGTSITAVTTPDPNGFGNDLVLTINATAADTTTMLSASPSTALWSPGDTALFRANVSVANGSANFYCFLQPVITTSTGTVFAADMLSSATYGAGPTSAHSYTLQTRSLPIPTGGTATYMQVNLDLNFVAAGSATVTISRFDAWKQ